MSVKITILGTTITLPSSGSAPNWAPAIIEAFKAIESALKLSASTYDIPAKTQTLTFSSGSADITDLNFPTADVRSAVIYYAVHRQLTSGATVTNEVTESGTLEIAYNNFRTAGQKWEVVRTGEGDASISFSVSDLGQVSFTTTALSGSGTHTGIISYRATSLLNT